VAPDLRRGGVGATGCWGDQRRSGSLSELEVKGGEGLLGQVIEGGHDLARNRVCFDLTGELDQDSPLRFFQDHIQGEQRSEGVLEGLGNEDLTRDPLLEQRRHHFDRADLGVRWATGWVFGQEGEFGALIGRLRAGSQSLCLGGVDRDPLGQGDFYLGDVRGGDAVGILEAGVRYLDFDR
jgi:hypothetical protein